MLVRPGILVGKAATSPARRGCNALVWHTHSKDQAGAAASGPAARGREAHARHARFKKQGAPATTSPTARDLAVQVRLASQEDHTGAAESGLALRGLKARARHVRRKKQGTLEVRSLDGNPDNKRPAGPNPEALIELRETTAAIQLGKRFRELESVARPYKGHPFSCSDQHAKSYKLTHYKEVITGKKRVSVTRRIKQTPVNRVQGPPAIHSGIQPQAWQA